MTVRVVPGEISAKGATTRTVIPTSAQPRWPPFERVAERIASSRRRYPAHRHEGVEVFTYVVEGAASHQVGADPARALEAGAATILTAPAPIAHSINLAEGQTLRWVATVTSLPVDQPVEARFQSTPAERPEPEPEGTILRRLVGPTAPLRSSVGMECVALEFAVAGTSFQRVGHNRLAVCYALGGRGVVDNAPVEAGEAALIEDAAGAAITGREGFRVLFASVPRPTPSGSAPAPRP